MTYNECKYQIIILFNFYDYWVISVESHMKVYNFIIMYLKNDLRYVVLYNIVSKIKDRITLLLLQKSGTTIQNLTFLFSYAQLGNHSTTKYYLLYKKY
jgi:hypothetical protein